MATFNKVLVVAGVSAVASFTVLQQRQINQNATDIQEITQAVMTIHQNVLQLDKKLEKFVVPTGERISYTAADELCLAKNIFYEAGVEDRDGKYAVAQVTINRLKTRQWGDTICQVVYSPSQFSWTLKKYRTQLPTPRGPNWTDSQRIAGHALEGNRVPTLDRALWYHTDYVEPYWRAPKHVIKQVGQHIFYSRAKGSTISL